MLLHTLAMEVLVQFGSPYAGPLSDAVWIVDTPENRTWFEQHVKGIDPNSAVFNEANDPLTILWHVFDHHPGWTEIIVKGVTLTAAIQQELAADAIAFDTRPNEFRLTRRDAEDGKLRAT
jgi:hypothetical protein